MIKCRNIDINDPVNRPDTDDHYMCFYTSSCPRERKGCHVSFSRSLKLKLSRTQFGRVNGQHEKYSKEY